MELDSVVTNLKSELLRISNTPMDESVFKKATESIHETLSSTECSLWSINRNITENHYEDDETVPISTSLLCRKVGLDYTFSKRSDFAHDLKKGFFNIVTDSPGIRDYYKCDLEEIKKYGHRSIDFVEELSLADFIVIPITDIFVREKVIAVLELSYQKCKIDDEDWIEIALVIKSFFSTLFHRYLVFRNDRLLIVHDRYRNDSVESFFDHLVDEEFRKFFDYQGASFFIWDTYRNRYNLFSTTDKEIDITNDKYSYTKEEGATGHVGTTGRPYIKDSIGKNYKWCEKTKDEPQTAMLVPIANPSNHEEVIGILRFINKKNPCNNNYIDYFNDMDLNLMEFSARYLSLVIYFYNKEEEQINLISKLAHEFKTPANAIFKSSTGLIDDIDDGDTESVERNLKPYLNDITDFAELQLWQAETTLYLSNNRQRKPNYKNQNCSLFQILKRSRDVARPIARMYKRIKFDNIVIHAQSSVDVHLNVDENAFVIVFYNLLTNAIKYHNYQNPDSFHVDIWYHVSDVAIEVLVEDYGIGIEKQNKESIFQLGFRGERAMGVNSSGFGVGLYVVEQIIKDYDGIIEVKSSKSPTSFEILLPKKLII